MSNVLQRGIEAHQRGDLAAAASLYRQTVGVAKHNLAVLHEAQGDYDQAITLYRDALEADPARDESAASLALTLLREGRYAEAWPLHERRRALKRLNIPQMKPDWPEWTDEDVAGKRLAVVGEQGLGDQIMFARFLEPLRARDADVRFVCSPELARLLGGQVQISRQDFDLWTYALSLPLRLGVTLETVPPPSCLPVRRRGGGGVGVMATGNPKFLSTPSARRLRRCKPSCCHLAATCGLRRPAREISATPPRSSPASTWSSASTPPWRTSPARSEFRPGSCCRRSTATGAGSATAATARGIRRRGYFASRRRGTGLGRWRT